MEAGKPDKVETEHQGRSLAGGVRDAVRARAQRRAALPDGAATPSRVGWRIAALAASLIAAGPLVTLVGANLLAERVRGEAARLDARLAPRSAAERSAAQARVQMREALARPALGTTLEAVARALPADAKVVRAARARDGALELEIATPDPDQLRSAMRSLPGIGTFRNTTQRQGDSGMIVSLRAERP